MNSFFPSTRVKRVKIENRDISKGESTEKLLQNLVNLNQTEKQKLINSSAKILRNCIPALTNNLSPSSTTGLVIGKIQSGKTLSFTSLIALARDNNYKIVIIISGRTNLLLKQTNDRLRKDLVKPDDNIKIMSSIKNGDRFDMIKILRKTLMRENKIKTLMIPVLKHQGWLNDLRSLFLDHSLNYLLRTNSVLIIDDEADQASLNTRARDNEKFGLNNESAIFGSIKSLRHSIPHHSFIQYTATPQAPLLLDTTMLLSPDWHVILSPGENYTGGKEFFDDQKEIVSIIPQEGNYPPDLNEFIDKRPPKSLQDSICEYLILSAIMLHDSEAQQKNRSSMLIHPTWRVEESETDLAISTFKDWTVNIIENLTNDLSEGIHAEFDDIYSNTISRLIKNGVGVDHLVSSEVFEIILDDVLDDIEIHQVTGGYLEKGEEFPWDNNRYHILIGGQLLDRGFTVENLLMTYMPRDSRGNNQSDTIEQRCRFYGYRKNYINYCRVYITHSLKSDYEDYNIHEEEIHNYLSNHSLEEFYRNGSNILMSRNLIPTNMSRLSDKLIKFHFRKFKFYNPQHPFIVKNNDILESFLSDIKSNRKHYRGRLEPGREKDHSKELNHVHDVYKVEIIELIYLLSQLEFNNKHEIYFNHSLMRYLEALKNDCPQFWLIDIACHNLHYRFRTVNYREQTKDGKNQYWIPTLGAGDKDFNDGHVYFGDNKLLIETDNNKDSTEIFGYNNELIVQLHTFRMKNKLKSQGEIKENDICKTLAFNFPMELEARYIGKNR